MKISSENDNEEASGKLIGVNQEYERLIELSKRNVLEIFEPFELVGSANSDSRWTESRDTEN